MKLNGAMRRIARTSEAEVPRTNMPACSSDDDEVADPEGEPCTVVGGRHRKRDHEEPAHPADQQEPEPDTVRGDRVREPRVSVVDPPDQEQSPGHQATWRSL